MRQMITMIILDSYFQRVVLIGTGSCPEFCDGMLQLKRYAAHCRDRQGEFERGGSEGFSDEIRNWFEFDRDWTRRGE